MKDEDDKRGIDFSLSKVPMAKIKDIMNNKVGEAVSGAKRKGNFSDHLQTIVKKHKQHAIYYANDVFSICAFDGAMMRQGTHKIVNMISFSTYYSPKFYRMQDS